MTRHLPLLVLLVLVAFIAVGCGKNTGTTTNSPTNKTTKSNKSSSMPAAPAGVPDKVQSMVQREWPRVQAAGEKFDTAFARCKAAMSSGNRPSQSDIDEAASALTALDGWAEIWNVVNDMQDDGTMDKKSFKMTSDYLRDGDRKVKAMNKKSKALKEFSTVK